MKRHIICERDVGLFSLFQQVISNIPWAIHEQRIPIVYFQDKTCYWTPSGYHGSDTVWEYYFEPVVAGHPASSIPQHVRTAVSKRLPDAFEVGYFVDESTFVSGHFGDHPELEGKSLWIPYLFDDPSDDVRHRSAAIVERYVTPRDYVRAKVEAFAQQHFGGAFVIGVHIRGTDAISSAEVRPHRRGSLNLEAYVRVLRQQLDTRPTARIFVATDDEASLATVREAFGARVLAYDSLRHRGGQLEGVGPTGWIMPAYIAGDRDLAAQNGEEAIVEYLLLSRCDYLVHNGSSLARTVLLTRPDLSHINTHHLLPDRAARALGDHVDYQFAADQTH
jgi:Nodulation protein Z (NodZ)